jgi:hypothetical protein
MTSDSNEGLSLVDPPTGAVTQHFRRSVWMLKEIQDSLQLIPDEAERFYNLALMDVQVLTLSATRCRRTFDSFTLPGAWQLEREV